MLTYDASLDVVKSYVYVTLTVAYLLMLHYHFLNIISNQYSPRSRK